MGMFDRMSPRERKLLNALGAVFLLLFLIGIPLYVWFDLTDTRKHNAGIREELAKLDLARELLATRRGEREATALRYAKPAPALGPFIEEAASLYELDVPESKPLGKNVHGDVTERATEVKMRKVDLTALVRTMEHIEQSGYPVAITKLEITTRGTDEYNVVMTVSAYDKKSDGAPAGEVPATPDATATGQPTTVPVPAPPDDSARPRIKAPNLRGPRDLDVPRLPGNRKRPKPTGTSL